MNFWHDFPSILWDVFKTGTTITCLVLLMMALIELINVSSSGSLMDKLHRYPLLQMLLAGLLGTIPGCAGGFAVVSLFTHNLLSFGALMCGMIATFGDEAFFLFAKSPKWGAILSLFLLALGFITGVILDLIDKKWHLSLEPHKFEVHDLPEDHSHIHQNVDKNSWKARLLHFFKEHLWKHVIKKHAPTVFLWSVGVLLFLKIFGYFIDIDTFMGVHQWAKFLMLLLAVGVGFIPESGPNLIFVMMFLQGDIPFAILLANSIAQNGHAGLPLLAQSRKNFFIMKGITVGLGLLCGGVLLLL